MKRKGKKQGQGQGRHVGTMLFWPVCVCVCVCVCVRSMIHTYHYSFPIIVKPLESECYSVCGNYDVMRWQLHRNVFDCQTPTTMTCQPAEMSIKLLIWRE